MTKEQFIKELEHIAESGSNEIRLGNLFDLVIAQDRESRWITDRLPEPKKGWNHSDRVLLWYEGTENHVESYGIGYYHYDPPFDDPKWIDFHYAKSRQPSGWQPLPEPHKL